MNEKKRTDMYRCMRLITSSLFIDDPDVQKDLAEKVTSDFLDRVVNLDWDEKMTLLKEYLGRFVNNTRIAHNPAKPMHTGVLRTYLGQRYQDVIGFETRHPVVKKCLYRHEGILAEPFQPASEVEILVLQVQPSENLDPSIVDQPVHQIRSTIVIKCPDCDSENCLNFIVGRYEFGATGYQHFIPEALTCSKGHAFYVDRALYSMHRID